MASKSARLFQVFALWAALFVLFGVSAGFVGADWPILIPLIGAFVHSLIVATSKR
jgi:hypothetical protein